MKKTISNRSHSPLQTQRNNEHIQTVVRFRPLSQKEQKGQNNSIYSLEMNESQIKITNNIEYNQKPYHYAFDRVFRENIDQLQFYRESGVQNLIKQFVEGYNGFVFAYGQSGTGKTYTLGTQDRDYQSSQKGIIQNSIEELFQHIASKENHSTSYDWNLEMGVIEVYCEEVYDLLNRNQKIVFKENNSTNQILVRIENIQQIQEILNLCVYQRKMSEQKLNKKSSRSHLIITLYLKQKIEDQEVRTKMRFVDLAGTEKLKKSQSIGQQLVEAKSINQSLSSLMNVIQALNNNNKNNYVPYRDSKFTRIFQDSLNRDSKIVVIGTICQYYDFMRESIATLKYIYECSKIQINPQQQFNNINRNLVGECVQQQNVNEDEEYGSQQRKEIEQMFQQKLNKVQEDYSQKERLMVKRMMEYEEQLDNIKQQFIDRQQDSAGQNVLNSQVLNNTQETIQIYQSRMKNMECQNTQLQGELNKLKAFTTQLLNKFMGFLNIPHKNYKVASDTDVDQIILDSKEKCKSIVEKFSQNSQDCQNHKQINIELSKILMLQQNIQNQNSSRQEQILTKIQQIMQQNDIEKEQIQQMIQQINHQVSVYQVSFSDNSRVVGNNNIFDLLLNMSQDNSQSKDLKDREFVIQKENLQNKFVKPNSQGSSLNKQHIQYMNNTPNMQQVLSINKNILNKANTFQNHRRHYNQIQ